MSEKDNSTNSHVESLIRATGSRVTYARMQVLSLLLAAKTPLSHSDIESQLVETTAVKIDRVTLYRVLDWLVETKLAHKAANTRGVLCFSALEQHAEHEQHMHFRCNDCEEVICLDIPKPKVPKLPKGFKVSSVDLEISGRCPSCSQAGIHH